MDCECLTRVLKDRVDLAVVKVLLDPLGRQGRPVPPDPAVTLVQQAWMVSAVSKVQQVSRVLLDLQVKLDRRVILGCQALQDLEVHADQQDQKGNLDLLASAENPVSRAFEANRESLVSLEMLDPWVFVVIPDLLERLARRVTWA